MGLTTNKKGFYASAPLIGSIIFLISASFTVFIMTENSAQMELAKTKIITDKLNFISQVIQTDTFKILIQNEFEKRAVSVLKDDKRTTIRNVATTLGNDDKSGVSKLSSLSDTIKRDRASVPLQAEFNDAVKTGFTEQLNRLYGITDAYSAAYGKLGIVCTSNPHRDTSTSQNLVSVYENKKSNDGTIVSNIVSLGQKITCDSSDPRASVDIDISEGSYKINVRIFKFAELIARVFFYAYETLSKDEYIVKAESPKWREVFTQAGVPEEKQIDVGLINKAITRVGNILQVDLGGPMGELQNNWKSLLGDAQTAIKGLAQTNEYNGLMTSLSIRPPDANGKGFDIIDDNFEVACGDGTSAASPNFANCRPDGINFFLGKEAQSNKNHIPISPIDLAVSATCDTAPCPTQTDTRLKQIFSPLQKGYAELTAVTPLCKKWIGRPKSFKITGYIQEGNGAYIPPSESAEALKMSFDSGSDPIVIDKNEGDIRRKQWSCREEGSGGYKEIVKQNTKKMLKNVAIQFGYNPTIQKWRQLGTIKHHINDPAINAMYSEVSPKTTPPTTCYEKSDNIEFTDPCTSNVPSSPQMLKQIKISIDLGSSYLECNRQYIPLCEAVCAGSNTCSSDTPTTKTTVCNDLINKGKATINCNGVDKTTIITSLKITVR